MNVKRFQRRPIIYDTINLAIRINNDEGLLKLSRRTKNNFKDSY